MYYGELHKKGVMESRVNYIMIKKMRSVFSCSFGMHKGCKPKTFSSDPIFPFKVIKQSLSILK